MSRRLITLMGLFAALAVSLTVYTSTIAQHTDDSGVGIETPREGADPENLKDPRPTQDDEVVKTAVRRGLRHIAKIQLPDGSWSNNIGNKLGDGYQINPDGYNRPNLGVTAICCMAFMASGNTPDRGEFKNNVAMGLKFILDRVDRQTGWISAYGTRMYEHAFCTLCLAEVYGMTRDEVVLDKLRSAAKFIVDSQNSSGSWRYVPNQIDSDMSICVCQLQALRAAANVGVLVPPQTIEQAKGYVRGAYLPRSGAFTYQHGSEFDSRDTFALTAAGVVALQSAGEYDSHTWDWTDPTSGRTFRRQIDLYRCMGYLQQRRPDGAYPSSTSSNRRSNYGFWYGHYYAAQAFYQYQYATGGLRAWEDWNKLNRSNFLRMQHDNGAWTDEIGGWDPEKNAYATAMACLILNIPAGYLPIFQN
ncbi:MAG: hypothetical protein IT462_01565 [Planctomycetes bacterium]|nr:hypothetical protein [Planctomycetota bacterium]